MFRLKYTGERYIPGLSSNNVALDHEERYKLARLSIKDGLILDIACGSGYGLNILIDPKRKLVGADISISALRYAKKKYGENKTLLVRVNAEKLPFNRDSFDAVVSFETIEHLKYPELFLQEIKRVLKSGGMLIISTPVRRGNLIDYYHYFEYDIPGFKQVLKKYFKIKEIYGQRFISIWLHMLYSTPIFQRLKVIKIIKSFYRRHYGEPQLISLTASSSRIPSFVAAICTNEK